MSDATTALMQVLTDLEQRVARLEAAEHYPYRLPIINRDGLPPFAANGTYFNGIISRTVTLRYWAVAVYVATTNNGANYWSIALSIGGVGTIATVTTSAIAANTGVVLIDSSILGNSYGTSNAYINIACTKTGAPGTLVAAPEIYAT